MKNSINNIINWLKKVDGISKDRTICGKIELTFAAINFDLYGF